MPVVDHRAEGERAALVVMTPEGFGPRLGYPADRGRRPVPGRRTQEVAESQRCMCGSGALGDGLPHLGEQGPLPAYDVGWAGFNTGLNAAHLDTALPNKAFEYLASGLPVATGPHRALRRLVEDEGVGMVVDDPAELGATLARTDLAAMRARVAERRHRFTVEGHIAELLAFYRRVADGPRGGTGPPPARLHSGG